jgi:hypothetical protein
MHYGKVAYSQNLNIKLNENFFHNASAKAATNNGIS